MIGVSLFFPLWFVAAHLCGGLGVALAAHLSTVALLALFVEFGWHWLRASRLARFVGRSLMRVRVGGELLELDSRRQYIFACEPHGPAALHLCFLFAAHGDLAMHEKMARRTVVMGHWLLVLLPFVCQLFQLCGVMFSWRATVDRALDRRSHVALCPSGIAGKVDAITRSFEPHTIVIRRRERFGFIALAARKNAVIVPVLSPDENSALTTIHWLCFAAGLTSKCDVAMRIGKPIDTCSLDSLTQTKLDKIASLYYEALVELAGDDYKIEFE